MAKSHRSFHDIFLLFFAMAALTQPSYAADEPKTDEAATEKPQEADKSDKADEKSDKTDEKEAKKDDVPAGRFGPDFCDFELTFPEAPMQTQRCMPSGDCYSLYSYTMVYDLQTTVDISVNCTPSTPANFKRYTQGVMKAALAGMVEERNLTSYDITYKEDGKYKNAALSGTGKTGAQDKIYTGQLWVGQNSVLTVQAELIGAEHKDADESFGKILQSLKFKEGKPMVMKKKTPVPNQGKNQ